VWFPTDYLEKTQCSIELMGNNIATEVLLSMERDETKLAAYKISIGKCQMKVILALAN